MARAFRAAGARCPPRDAGATMGMTGVAMRMLSGSRVLFIGMLLFLSVPSFAEVLKIVVNDTIHPITDEYIGRALAEAERNKDQALLIELNTPGGLVDSTRDIIEKILASPVPVIIYVTPSGSRAASAGFFILESADVAAMAPGNQYRRRPSGDAGRRQSGRRDEGKDGERRRRADAFRGLQARAATSKWPRARCASRSHLPIRRRSPRS